MIKVNNLSKSYGTKQVLKNVNAEFNDSEIYGLVGYNGAGKTTLFNCLAGIIPYSGSMSFDDKLSVGYLPTELYMYPKITGLEYIEFCLSARKKKLDRGQLQEWNSFMHLPLNKYAKEYSTGMLKKLALLALILQRNDILILDEPFNGLDLSTNIILSEILKRMKELGKLIVVSSHILQPLKDICTAIDIIEDGKLIRYYNTHFNDIDLYFEEEIKKVLDTNSLIV